MGYFDKFVLETKTALGPQPDGVFLLAENRDIFLIVRNDTTPGSPPAVAVHVLTAASGYHQRGLETKTALGPQPDGDFLLAENRDIFLIVRNDTTPGSPPAVAVHVLTAASGYQQRGLETKTALGPQPDGDFLLAENRDIFLIVRNDTTPGSPPAVAVHVLTAASGYHQRGLETKTALGPQPDGDFLLAENRDIFFIVGDDTTPGSPPAVAVHVLTAASGYQQRGLETKTALGPQPDGDFLLASNDDLFLIVRDDATPGSPPAVAVHVLGPGPSQGPPPAQPPPPQKPHGGCWVQMQVQNPDGSTAIEHFWEDPCPYSLMSDDFNTRLENQLGDNRRAIAARAVLFPVENRVADVSIRPERKMK